MEPRMTFYRKCVEVAMDATQGVVDTDTYREAFMRVLDELLGLDDDMIEQYVKEVRGEE